MMMMIRCSMKQNRASGKRGRGRKRKQETGTNKQATKLRRRTCVVYLDVDDRPVDEPEARSLAPWIRRTVGRGKKRARRAESGREAPNPRKLIKKIQGALGFAGTRRDRRPNCALALSRLVWWMRRAEMGRAQLLCFALLQAAARASVRVSYKESRRENGSEGRSNRPTGGRGGRVGLVHAPRGRGTHGVGGSGGVRPVQRVAPRRAAWGRK
jgi:hypothetical protein